MKSISVVIPAKNEGKYIAACLQALRKAVHLYGDTFVEIILVDNGSIDATSEIASSFNCKVIKEPLAKTISKLRNIGASNAKNEILAFLDADCLVDPKWMKLCVDIITHNDNIGVVGTPAVPDLCTATWVEKSLYKLMSGSVSRPNFVKWLGTSNIFVYKALFVQVGGFNETFLTAEDVNFCYAIARKNKLIYLEKRVNTIHTRESKTLIELFKRELWRGSNSLHSFIINNFSRNEFLSVLVPAVNFFSFFLFFLGIAASLSMVSVGSLSLIMIFPAILIVKKKVPVLPLIDLPRYYLVSFVYLLARTCALVLECISLCKGFFR